MTKRLWFISPFFRHFSDRCRCVAALNLFRSWISFLTRRVIACTLFKCRYFETSRRKESLKWVWVRVRWRTHNAQNVVIIIILFIKCRSKPNFRQKSRNFLWTYFVLVPSAAGMFLAETTMCVLHLNVSTYRLGVAVLGKSDEQIVCHYHYFIFSPLNLSGDNNIFQVDEAENKLLAQHATKRTPQNLVCGQMPCH